MIHLVLEVMFIKQLLKFKVVVFIELLLGVFVKQVIKLFMEVVVFVKQFME